MRRVGGWVIYAGALAAVSCGRTPLGEPFGITPGDDDDDIATSPTGQPSPSPSATPTCGDCATVSGSPSGLNRSDLLVDEVAYHSGLKLLICRDGAGYFAMSSLCAHSGCDLGVDGVFDPMDLPAGFSCNCHGSRFNGSGVVTQGPSLASLTHYRMSMNGGGDIFVDLTPPFIATSCRCP